MKTAKLVGICVVSVLFIAPALAGTAYAVPVFKQVAFLPGGSTTSVDLSPDGTMLCVNESYGDGNKYAKIYDANTLDVLKNIHLSQYCTWECRFSADNAYVYCTDYYGGNVGKVSLATGLNTKSIPVGNWPCQSVFDSDRGYLYVGQNTTGYESTGSIQVIDTQSDTVVGSTALIGIPGGIVLSHDEQFLYATAWNHTTNYLYKIRTSDYSVAAMQPIDGPAAGAISLSADDALLYVPNIGNDTVQVIETDTLAPVSTLSLNKVDGFFAAPNAPYAVVTSAMGGYVSIFDLNTGHVTQEFSRPAGAYDNGNNVIYWDLDRNRVYIPFRDNVDGGLMILEAVPEPGTMALIAPAILGLAGIAFRKMRGR